MEFTVNTYEAETDFDQSYEYYFKNKPNVAGTLFKSVNQSFKDILQNPFTYPTDYKDIQKNVVKKFLFVIYYQVVQSIIKVVAIFHTSRNP